MIHEAIALVDNIQELDLRKSILSPPSVHPWLWAVYPRHGSRPPTEAGHVMFSQTRDSFKVWNWQLSLKMKIFNVCQKALVFCWLSISLSDNQLTTCTTNVLTHLLANCCPDVILLPQNSLETLHFGLTARSKLAEVANRVEWYQVYNLQITNQTLTLETDQQYYSLY